MGAIVCAFNLWTNGYAQDLEVIGYNVESGGANPTTLAQRISGVDGCDIWGFCEVQNQSWANAFEVAAEDGENAAFTQILGNTGGGDKLLIVFDSDRFELTESFELDEINVGGECASAPCRQVEVEVFRH